MNYLKLNQFNEVFSLVKMDVSILSYNSGDECPPEIEAKKRRANRQWNLINVYNTKVEAIKSLDNYGGYSYLISRPTRDGLKHVYR